MKYCSYLNKKKSSQPPFGWKIARNLTHMTGIKENGTKHCYRADKQTTLLEPSLQVLFITLKMPKMKMAALFGKN